jgi:hypothetical protein
VGLRKCAISGASSLETPLGALSVDDATREQLLNTGLFDVTSQRIDEEEHSIEMHLPFLAMALKDASPDCAVLPIMVGSISSSRGALQYAHILQPYFNNPENLFVISRWVRMFWSRPVLEAVSCVMLDLDAFMCTYHTYFIIIWIIAYRGLW